MRFCQFYLSLIFVALTAGYAVAAETTRSITVRDAGKTYQLKEDQGALLLIDQQGARQIASCSEGQVEKLAHPALDLTALVYIRDCGATTDFATHVAIVKSGETPQVIAVFSGKPKIVLRWGGQGLEIAHSSWPAELIFKQDTQASGQQVTYKVSAEIVKPTDPKLLGFSSFNFGVMGRTAGFPAEVLSRWAGWAQMASGLYKPGFGAWFGDAPYGDDPNGSAAILAGFQFYESHNKKQN